MTSILNLPDEVITLILVHNDPQDIMHFGASCKRFQELVSNNDYLWKIKYSDMFQSELAKLVSKYGDGNWFKEVKNFYKLKQNVCNELLSMPSKHYWRVNEVSVKDVGTFFSIATENNQNFYYTLLVLQEIVDKGNTIIDTNKCLQPLYTLTVIYYAKIILRYLLHTYMAMNWFQKHVRTELTPVFVTNFFLQWIDVTKIYKNEDVEHKIQSLIKKVKDILEFEPNTTENKKYSEKEVLQVISKVIYNNCKVSTSPNSSTLNIVKVIDENVGNIISYGAIYQAVAKHFGLKCELIAFPNHLFLEWKNTDEQNNSQYINTIDLFNGEIKPKRRCPFSNGGQSNYEYCPDSLLQFIYTSYIKSKGPMKDCKTQNADLLWNFFTNSHSGDNPYKNLLIYLVRYADSQAVKTTLNMRYMEKVHREMMIILSTLNACPTAVYREKIIKRRHDTILYPVGVICYHSVYNYMCVIRGWEVDGNNLPVIGFDDLQFGKDQPFYRVLAGDQSERFVAQENLRVIYTPFRIQNLEESLAREFTHFDGFSYVPNDQKLIEYPDEQLYIEVCKRCSPR